MSFRKAKGNEDNKPIPGTRYQTQSQLNITSTGCLSFDEVMGGGIPVGAMILVEEDRLTDYSKTLQSLFESQGVSHGQELLVIKPGLNSKIELSLPESVSEEKKKRVEKPKPENNQPRKDYSDRRATGDSMKIAWRYNSLQKIRGPGLLAELKEDPDNKYCNSFDITKTIGKDGLDAAKIDTIDVFKLSIEAEKDGQSVYGAIYGKIASFIERQQEQNAIVRISIHSIGSLFWGQDNGDKELLVFLHSLRGLLRKSNRAVCMLSLPVSLYKDTGSEQRQTIVRRIEHQCDAVVELESFEGAECGELAILKTQKTRNVISNQSNEYHGFFHIHKNFSLNSMFPIADKTSLLKSEGSGGSENNLAFKLKKKKFSIETYHLPIEGGTSERRVPDSASSGSNSSATGVPNRLTTKLSQRQSNLSQSVTDF